MMLTVVKQTTKRFNPVACFSANLHERRPERGEIKATINYLKSKNALGQNYRIIKNAYGQIAKIVSDGSDVTSKCIDILMRG